MATLDFLNDPNYHSAYISYRKDGESPYVSFSTIPKNRKYGLSVVFKDINTLSEILRNTELEEKAKYKAIPIYEKFYKSKNNFEERNRVTLTINKETKEELRASERDLKRIIAENKDKIIDVNTLFDDDLVRDNNLSNFSYPDILNKKTIEFYETYKDKLESIYLNIFFGEFPDNYDRKYFVSIVLDNSVPFWKVSPVEEEYKKIPLLHSLSWRLEKPQGNLYIIPASYANTMDEVLEIMQEHKPENAYKNRFNRFKR